MDQMEKFVSGWVEENSVALDLIRLSLERDKRQTKKVER